MFHHPAWAVDSYISGPPAGGTLQIKSTKPRPETVWVTLYLQPILLVFTLAKKETCLRDILANHWGSFPSSFYPLPCPITCTSCVYKESRTNSLDCSYFFQSTLLTLCHPMSTGMPHILDICCRPSDTSVTRWNAYLVSKRDLWRIDILYLPVLCCKYPGREQLPLSDKFQSME